MDNDTPARDSGQAQHIAQLLREISALRTLLSAMIEAWRAPNTGRMVRLVAEAEKTLLTTHESGVH